jgi:O-antigen ligase
MGSVALVAFCVWLAWVYSRDVSQREGVSAASWIVLVWAVGHGTRPLTSWFLGVDSEVATSRDEGNPIEASIDLLIILSGAVVLARRGVRLSSVLKDNIWISLFYGFWFLSIMWSDYPFMTFKRVFRDLSSLVMALVILTELNPGQAMRAVCARLVYAGIPLSILLYKYFPEWGRFYGGYNLNDQMFVGVTTHKNTLGVLAMVGALFLLWDLLERFEARREKTKGVTTLPQLLVLCMCWYLLLTIDCVTALVCAGLGSALLLVLRGTSVGRYPVRTEVLGVTLIGVFLLLEATLNITETFVTSLGRDMTLTTRTDIWSIVREYQDNPLLGAGFNTFWAGERYRLLSSETGGIHQAHNGYLETYLNGGWIGVGLLGCVLIAAYRRIRKGLSMGRAESTMSFVVLIIAVVHNYSEASFNKTVLLWFVTLVAIMQYTGPRSVRVADRMSRWIGSAGERTARVSR